MNVNAEITLLIQLLTEGMKSSAFTEKNRVATCMQYHSVSIDVIM